jgi:hypothetical protein
MSAGDGRVTRPGARQIQADRAAAPPSGVAGVRSGGEAPRAA